MKPDSEQNEVSNKEIKEVELNTVPEFYKSPTANPSLGRMAGNIEVKSNIPVIVETIRTVVPTTDFKYYFRKTYKEVPLVQGIAGDKTSISLITPNNTNVIVTTTYVNLKDFLGGTIYLNVYDLSLP